MKYFFIIGAIINIPSMSSLITYQQSTSNYSLYLNAIAIIIIFMYVREKLKKTKKVSFGGVFTRVFSSASTTAPAVPARVPAPVATVAAPVAPVAPATISFKCPCCLNSYPDRVKYGKEFDGEWFCGNTCNTMYKTRQMYAKQFAPQCNTIGFFPANPALVPVFPLKVIPDRLGVTLIF